jgi:arylsulfatase A-like enzyme
MKKHNVLFITCDQLRQDALGLYGNRHVKTPNLDALFANGVRFDNMFAAHPVCSPNRGAIATGRWPKVNGLVFNGYVLPDTETTMMDVFRQNQYTTYGVGKMHFEPQWNWHSDFASGKGARNPQPEKFPWHGFDHCQITEDHRVGPYATHLEEHGFSPWADIHSASWGLQHSTRPSAYPPEHHQTHWIADQSIRYLREHDPANPFFMWTSFVDPHHPFNPPTPYDRMYDPDQLPSPIYLEGENEKRNPLFSQNQSGRNLGHCTFDGDKMSDRTWREIKAAYYGMISFIDDNIGRIIQTLKEMDEYDNTIFVFTSDHGELLGDHHLLYKFSAFDCVTRVPFLVKRPGLAARRVDALCRSLDIMPTILESTQLPIPGNLNGRSLEKHLDGMAQDDPSDAILIEQQHYHTVRSKKYRLTVFHNESLGELYDVEEDPENFHNLWESKEHSRIKDELTSLLVKKMYQDVMNPEYRKIGPW